MTDDTQFSAQPNPDVVTIPDTEVRVPRRLELPANVDTTGRVWPVGGITRVTRLPLATLLECGVTVQWRMPDGTVIDQDTGALLVASRQADMDKGFVPEFPAPASANTAGEPAVASGSEKA